MGELSGKWSSVMEYRSSRVVSLFSSISPFASTIPHTLRIVIISPKYILLILFIIQNDRKVLFDVAKDGQNIAPKYVSPEDEQEANESRRYVYHLVCLPSVTHYSLPSLKSA